MGNCVSINLRKNEIVIKIAEDAEQKKIISELTKKLSDLKKLYKEDKTPIKIVGKVLKNKEIDEIQELIKEKIDVDIDFDMPKSLGLSSITRTFKQEVAISETKFHRGSLRSGQRLETEGSIVIIGDVNSGAEVIASDNIVVLGNLRGLAHAGAKGNKNAIIAAGKLDAVQLRISNIVKEIDRDEEPVHRQAYVFVEDDKIIIE
ncbi:MAG: septum site-determining protein MinC [Clostridia bacterium]|jgi:probable septum site-determining protein minC|nr:probable septum site-determining protein MinC [Clostridium sp. CAG:389]